MTVNNSRTQWRNLAVDRLSERLRDRERQKPEVIPAQAGIQTFVWAGGWRGVRWLVTGLGPRLRGDDGALSHIDKRDLFCPKMQASPHITHTQLTP